LVISGRRAVWLPLVGELVEAHAGHVDFGAE
jgi:hypothetical protein